MLYTEDEYRAFLKGDMLSIQRLLEKYGAIEVNEFFEGDKRQGNQKPKFVIKENELFVPGKSFTKQLTALITVIESHAYQLGVANEKNKNFDLSKNFEAILASEKAKRENLAINNRQYRNLNNSLKDKVASLELKLKIANVKKKVGE